MSDDYAAERDAASEPTWRELERQFGETEVGLIDRAISEYLSRHHEGIKRENFYLVSEGLAYAVLLAMRDNGIRFQRAVRSIR